jgi:tetratricopeptide (TPR) repeat protein
MGDIHMGDSQIDRALEAYSRALNIDPNHFEARLRRAKLYVELNNYGDAVADLEQAAKVNPYSGEVYLLRSQCYEILGDSERARQDTWKARVFADR